MKITSVSFGRTKSLPGEFGNIRISVSADIEEGETPEQCIRACESLVDHQVAERIATMQKLDDQRYEAQNLRVDLDELRQQIASKAKVLKQFVDLMDHHGVNLPDREYIDSLIDYDPFADEGEEPDDEDTI